MTTLVQEPEAALGAVRPRAAARLGPDWADPWAEPIPVTFVGFGSRPRRKADACLFQGAGPAPFSRRAATRGRARRLVARALFVLPAASGLALLLAISLPVLFGCRSLVVMSGSMEPAIATGSVVVVERIPAVEIAVGDVVSFRPPEDPARVLTHRVQAVAVEEGAVAVETRGDANTGSESWAIEPAGTVGRLVFQIPYLGYLLAPLQGLLARLLLVVVPAVLLGALLLREVWRPRPGPARSRGAAVPVSVGSSGA